MVGRTRTDLEELVLSALNESRLGQGIRKEQLSLLLQAGLASVRVYRQWDMIFRDEDRPRSVMILCDGSLITAQDTPFGLENRVGSISARGTSFGSLSYLLEKDSYRLYAKAQEDSVVLEIDARLIDPGMDVPKELKETADTLRKNEMRLLALNNYYMIKKLRALSASGIRGKIIQYLLDNSTPDSNIVHVMSRREMAAYLHVTRPALSRELNNMASDGLIALKRGEIRIVDAKLLEQGRTYFFEEDIFITRE